MTKPNEPLLTFPCEFSIKVMGKATEEFELTVLQIIRNFVPDLAENAIRARYSKDKNYLSLTVTVIATNQAMLDNIYRELSAHESVLMAL